MSPRMFVIILAGIIYTLLTFFLICTPILPTDLGDWRPVPEAKTRSAATRGEWVLLPSNSGSYCLPRGFLSAYEIWRPDSGQLAQLEHDLDQILPPIEVMARKGLAESIPPLLSYRRQYVGVRRLGEPQIIFVNAFLPEEEDHLPPQYRWNWRRRLACVDDGGWGYWHFEYDSALRRYRGFSFNGDA